MSAIAAEVPARSDELFGHPKGLYVCFFTEMWERFSFYGMKALLLLYLHEIPPASATTIGYDLIGAYGGLVYAMPVIGGLLADRWLGMRKAVVFGGILLVLGHLGMAIEGHPASSVNGVVTRDAGALQMFYFSLALIIMGVGFLKPNISTIVGKLYAENDPRRDSGFSLFYAGINIGATVSRRSSAAGSARRSAGAGVSARPASACSRASRTSSTARNTCAVMPNRRIPRGCASACSVR